MSEIRQIPGLITRHSVHYTADPSKRGAEWKEYARAGQTKTSWAREMEMDPKAGALTAVFREVYRQDFHERALEPPRDARLFHAWDFGKGWPARVWFGRTAWNGIRVYASMVGQSIQLGPFADQTIAWEVRTWGEVVSGPRCFCDPAGNQEKDDGVASVKKLREYGWQPSVRGGGNEEGVEQAAQLMREIQPDGEPSFLIDPRYNHELCAALSGALKRNKAGVIEREHPSIDLWDALKYGIRGTMPPKATHRQDAPTFRTDPVSGYGRPPMPGMVRAIHEEGIDSWR